MHKALSLTQHHTYNPNFWRWKQEGQKFRANLGYMRS